MKLPWVKTHGTVAGTRSRGETFAEKVKIFQAKIPKRFRLARAALPFCSGRQVRLFAGGKPEN